MRKLLVFIALMMFNIYHLEAKHRGRSPSKLHHDGNNILTPHVHHPKHHKAGHGHGHNAARKLKDGQVRDHKNRKTHDHNRKHHRSHKHKRGADYFESFPVLDYDFTEYESAYDQHYQQPTYYHTSPCASETTPYEPSEITTTTTTTRKPYYQHWDTTKVTTTTEYPKVHHPKPIKAPELPKIHPQHDIKKPIHPVPATSNHSISHVVDEIKETHQSLHDALVQRHKNRLTQLVETVKDAKDKTVQGVKSMIDHLLPSKQTTFHNGCGCEQQILQLEQSILLLEEQLLKIKSFLAAREASISDGKTKIVKIVKKPKTTADGELIVA